MVQIWEDKEQLLHEKANHLNVRKGTTTEIGDLDEDDIDEGDVIANTTKDKLLVNIGTSASPFWTSDFLPIGIIRPWGGSISSLPTGWKRCNGDAISRSTYDELYDIVGTTYGTGDGSTTFDLPDLEEDNKFILGAESDSELNDTGGDESHTLTISELPSHSHIYGGITSSYGSSSSSGYFSSSGTINTGYTGGGGSHENRPPYINMIFIIKVERV